MWSRALVLSFSLAVVILPACSSSSVASPSDAPEPTGGLPLLGADCDPLVPQHCGLPFPSNVWLVDGKITFGPTTLPKLHGTTPLDPSLFRDRDGFSPGMASLFVLEGATAVGLATPETIPVSLEPGSPTVLIDAETGEHIPHFVDLDFAARTDDDTTMILRPVLRLKDAHRYIVAARHVKAADGKDIEPTAAFRALRDNTESSDASVRRRRGLYDDIFGRLEAHGVPRSELQIAWDYTTASRANTTSALLSMRDDALALVGADGPEYVITKTEDNPNEHILKRLHGLMTVPLYLDKATVGGKMNVGPDGRPARNGTAQFEFVIHIPKSIKDGVPMGLVQNGHGLLGSKEEASDGQLAIFCDRFHYIGFAVDMIGMAHEDVDTVLKSVSDDISLFRGAVDRQHQGMLNQLLVMRMMKGRFTKDPSVQIDGKSAIDPTNAHYRGDSQGGIFGGTYMSLSTDVTRGLLGVPGMPYNMLLDRSADFAGYKFLLAAAFPTAIDTQLVLGLLQLWWDRTEPNGYVPYMREDMLPGTPSHDVLMHVAIGDYQVSPLGAHIMARALKAKNLRPVNREIFGVESADGPLTGSAMVEYDFGLAPPTPGNVAPDRTNGLDPHGKPRGLEPSYLQQDKWFREGVITPFCDGPCNPL
jgi:hypothetical protein